MANLIYQNWTPGTVLTIHKLAQITIEGFTLPGFCVGVDFPNGVHTSVIIRPSVFCQSSNLYRKAHMPMGNVSEFVRKFETWEEAFPYLKDSKIIISDMVRVPKPYGTIAVFKFDFVSA